jgi:hypothetical protein
MAEAGDERKVCPFSNGGRQRYCVKKCGLRDGDECSIKSMAFSLERLAMTFENMQQVMSFGQIN